MQYAWNKYGENNFEFAVLNTFHNELDMIEAENNLIHCNYIHSYNMSKTANPSFVRGHKVSETTKDRIKIARAKQIMTSHRAETIEKIKTARAKQAMKRVIFITELGIFVGYDNLCAAHNICQETARKWIRDKKVNWNRIW